MGIIKKKLTVSFVALTFLALFSVFFTVKMKQAEAQRIPVEIKANETKTLFFYKEDCPDCKKIFPFVYTTTIFTNKTVFINLNEKENRKYISMYQLESVPTFIHENKRYSGTDNQQIKEILND